MIYGIVKKIMQTGITKYAKKFNQEAKDVQIKVTIDLENQRLRFAMCDNFKEVEVVSFLDIMDKRFDILGYEVMATPYLGKCITNFCEEKNIEVSDAVCFILLNKEKLMIAFYDKFTFIKGMSLEQQLEEIGLG